MRECLWLIKYGIPFDVAFQLDDLTRTAWCVMFSEMEGNKFNWETLQFEENRE